MVKDKNNAQRIYGYWTEGFVFDDHVKSSKYLGRNEVTGYDEWENNRSLMGEFIYQLKYKNDISAVKNIVDLCMTFLSTWLRGKNVDIIIPAPFSKDRKVQPVNLIAHEIAQRANKTYRPDLLRKNNNAESKSQFKKIEIEASLNESLPANVLIVDDVYQTGATLRETASVIAMKYNVKNIYVFCLTKARIRNSSSDINSDVDFDLPF